MKNRRIIHLTILAPIFILLFLPLSIGQTVINGVVQDVNTGEPLIGANVVISGTTEGCVTDWDGNFVLKSEATYPISLIVSYLGYNEEKITLEGRPEKLKITLSESSMTIDVVEVKGQRISEKQKESPLTIESMDIIAIKETPSANFYDGLGSLKDVDLTTASLGFTIINTRGFNSTSPVRSLQIIDGVDNQSPGLNFSLGNFLGSSELDVNKVELIVGASSAFYGPNAFNGVISMETKDPFFHKGLSAMVKVGERSLFETALRWADALKNSKGYEWMAYKFNLSYMKAYDWEADNYDPVFDTESNKDNPGGYDAVNIYGDEYTRWLDFRKDGIVGLGLVHRTGYKEKDLVDYNSENKKAAAAVHFRLQPTMGFQSSEIILGSSFGGGTTVYQGDNRFSLRDIKFFQHKLEVRKKDNFFLRTYVTHEDAGSSYDPYFTALKLQSSTKGIQDWQQDFTNYWNFQVSPFLKDQEGFPKKSDYRGDPIGYDSAITSFLIPFKDSLFIWNQRGIDFANADSRLGGAFLQPGTPAFDSAFHSITSRNAFSEDGTRFYDKSALIHIHGQKEFKDILSMGALENLDLTLGANFRKYLPNSKGSILLDTFGRKIDTYEWGVYGGATGSFLTNTLKANASLRMDKHQNFGYLFSPALSLVYKPSDQNFMRASFSSAIRNPTLSDQYLRYDVGPAILLGNISGFDSLVTLPSLGDYLSTIIGNPDTLEYFNLAPIQPEQVRTFELGYRSTLMDALFVDMGYYYSWYENFIGYQLGAVPTFNSFTGGLSDLQVYRVSTNAKKKVTTQGFSIGLNYYFFQKYLLKGNYSWNVLNTKTDDPIIPAFNTPEHKFNIGLSAREMQVGNMRKLGFNINYKWIEGFLFEGSPQFTGFIPSYGLLDAQINWTYEKINTTFKLGASNILNTMNFQTYGGPRIGRLAYFSLTYNWNKK